MSQVMQDVSGRNGGIVAIFVMVYAGMILGGLPRLKLNRSGVARRRPPTALICPPCCCCFPSWWCRRRCAWVVFMWR